MVCRECTQFVFAYVCVCVCVCVCMYFHLYLCGSVWCKICIFAVWTCICVCEWCGSLFVCVVNMFLSCFSKLRETFNSITCDSGGKINKNDVSLLYL